jgi:hypothetical protein
MAPQIRLSATIGVATAERIPFVVVDARGPSRSEDQRGEVVARRRRPGPDRDHVRASREAGLRPAE